MSKIKIFETVKITDEELYYYAKTDEDRKIIDKVIQKYPVKITRHLRELMKDSEAVRMQYLPSPREFITKGTPIPFEEGKESAKTYGLERVYKDRVLIAPNFDCPAYCRYCYKKSRVLRNKRGMSYEEIDSAIAEVSKMEGVRGVVITGGEPLYDLDKLFYLLNKIYELDTIVETRVGTRALLNQPNLFTDEIADKFASYLRPNFENSEKSKYLAFNVHFNHPDELSPEVVKACYKLTKRGLILRNQAVLLKGINDDVSTAKKLFSMLLRNNIVVYYYNHCMPVEGADHLRTSVQKGLDIYRQLCTESSTAVPNYVYATPGGKTHVGADSKLVYKEIDGIRYIETIMPYLAEDFKRITKKELPPLHEATPEGLLKGLYLDGDDD